MYEYSTCTRVYNQWNIVRYMSVVLKLLHFLFFVFCIQKMLFIPQNRKWYSFYQSLYPDNNQIKGWISYYWWEKWIHKMVLEFSVFIQNNAIFHETWLDAFPSFHYTLYMIPYDSNSFILCMLMCILCICRVAISSFRLYTLEHTNN